MKELVKYNLLLDEYLNLFTKKQIKYLQDYFYDDFSYSEIADKYHITKTAVYDSINQARKLLLSYESKLHILEKKVARIECYQKISDIEIQNKLLKMEQK